MFTTGQLVQDSNGTEYVVTAPGSVVTSVRTPRTAGHYTVEITFPTVSLKEMP